MTKIAASAANPPLTLADLEAFDPGTSPSRTERRFACPLCDTRPRHGGRRSLSVNTETGLWICFRCGESGKLRERWQDRPRLTGRERRRAALRQSFSLKPEAAPEVDDDPSWRDRLAGAQPLHGTRGEAYLVERGLSPEIAAAAGAQFIPSWYRRPGVAYPLRNEAGELVGVGVRYVDGRDDPKTRSGGRLKYGVFATPGAFESSVLVLVEGPADALALAGVGIPAVALHRTGAPAWVIRRCAFRRVAVALDADVAGDEGSEKLLAAVQGFGAAAWRVRAWPETKDWADVLTAFGADMLRRLFFHRIAGPAWADAYQRHGRLPHPGLEAAINAADWRAFDRELTVYELPSRPAEP